MEAMIDRTLALARSGRVISDTEPVDLAATVDRCWDNVDTADATVSVEATATLLADPDRLAHLFENLFRNAVDHAGDDVAVRVGTLDGGFYVADDGPGIPEAERETLLSADRVDTDSGFGLLIVGRIADAHGWAVAVTDSGAGGARFEVTGVEFAEEGRSGTGRGTDKQCRTDSPGGRGPGTGGQ
jgi:signal transduction histidine kinase